MGTQIGEYPLTLGVFIFGFSPFSRKVYDKLSCLVVVSVGFEGPGLAVYVWGGYSVKTRFSDPSGPLRATCRPKNTPERGDPAH
jgi:hypothetical protein